MSVKVIGPMDGADEAGTQRILVSPILDMEQEAFKALASSIVLAVPHRPSEGIQGALMDSLIAAGRFATPIMRIPDQFQGFIEMTRTGICRQFMEYAHTRPHIRYLVMIDNDEGVDWDAPYRLALWDKPIVSGVVCYFAESRGIVACFTMKDAFGVPRFPSLNLTGTMPGRGLIKVHSMGAGLICIRKDVIEAILNAGKHPFLIPEEERERSALSGFMKYGEDVAFCRQAEELGFDRYVDLSVHADHFKTIRIRWPGQMINHELDPQKWTVDEREYAHAG